MKVHEAFVAGHAVLLLVHADSESDKWQTSIQGLMSPNKPIAEQKPIAEKRLISLMKVECAGKYLTFMWKLAEHACLAIVA